jgi:trimethylamine--corrinoid protein Co-methyltransferase
MKHIDKRFGDMDSIYDDLREDILAPRFNVLTTHQIERIHQQSLDILFNIGVIIESPTTRNLFARAVGEKRIQGERVLIPPELVSHAIEKVPNSVSVYRRDGTLGFRLPGDTRFGIGMTALYYQDPNTGEVSPFRRQDMVTAVRLGDCLDSYDTVATVGILKDVKPGAADLYATLEMIANTNKPLIVLASQHSNFSLVLDLLEHLHGDLEKKPFVLPYINPVTPLVIDRSATHRMEVAIQRSLPFIFVNYGLAGATTPITPAGELALLNAELLAGVTLSQLYKEGTPVILGSLPAVMDMQTMTNYYAAESYLVSHACAEMMAHYGLPHCGTSGAAMGWGADLVAGGHQWFNHLTGCMGQFGLVPAVGAVMGSTVFSPELIVSADEIIRQVRAFCQGIVLSNETFAMPEITSVGAGGNYLSSDLTRRLFRDQYFRSDIFPCWDIETWRAKGSPRSEELLNRHTRQLIDELKEPEDYNDMIQKGEAFIRKTTQS